VGTSRSMTIDAAIRAVLFDRDGTLIFDVPYNGDPALVRPVPAAASAVRRLRDAGLAVGIITNQSGIARGLVTPSQLAAVNARVDELLGPFDVWGCCPHAESDGCRCRKPQPGLVLAACAALGVSPAETVVIGDIGSDMGAAGAAGAWGILVPTPVTHAREIAMATIVAGDLSEAVDLVLAPAAAQGVA
jgi:D-glycero-D-manno-heptose 1,7-bisphosphate phosphatase